MKHWKYIICTMNSYANITYIYTRLPVSIQCMACTIIHHVAAPCVVTTAHVWWYR